MLITKKKFKFRNLKKEEEETQDFIIFELFAKVL